MSSRAHVEKHFWKGSELTSVEVLKEQGKINPTLILKYNEIELALDVCTIDLDILQSALARIAEIKADSYGGPKLFRAEP